MCHRILFFFRFIFPLLFKNVKAILGLLAYKRQAADQIWLVSRMCFTGPCSNSQLGKSPSGQC